MIASIFTPSAWPTRAASLPKKRGRDRIFGGDTDWERKRETRSAYKVSPHTTWRAVSQALNIFASLPIDWRIKKHASSPHLHLHLIPATPTHPTSTHTHDSCISFHFIISHVGFFLPPFIISAPTGSCLALNSHSRLIILRVYLLFFFFTVLMPQVLQQLLGAQDGHSEWFDLAWASCKVHHPPNQPPHTHPPTPHKDRTTYQW